MESPSDNFKIKLNQNLWGLVVSFGFLGAAEYYGLCVLFGFAVFPAAAMTVSILFTTCAYTRHYMSKKSA